MASMSQMADDIFTCTLCLEKVREPRTLPCLHTFCRYCLSAYVRQTVRDWAFPCPLCSQETRPPTKGLPVDQWLETFPTSNFLQQLTRVTEARQAERACDICRQEQVLVEAAAWCRSCMEALCSDCHRVHTRSRASRDHVLISMDSLMNDPLDKLVTPIFRNDVANAKKHIDDHARAAGHVAERVEEHLEQLTKSRDVAVEEVESLKRRLVEMVEARSAKLLTDIESTYSQQREVLAQRAAQGRALERVLNRTTRFLEHLLAYGTEPDLLGNFDNIVQQTRLVDSQTAAVKQGNDNTTLKFIPDKKATETLRNLTSLGEVKVIRAGGRGKDPTKDENFTKNGKGDNKQVAVASPRLSPRKVSSFGKSPRATPSKSPRAKLVASFSGRTNSDTMRTDLRGVVCLRSGDIIVMDVHFRNKRLKKFSPRGKLISVVDTGECPYGMALIPDTDLVVTHPRSREFVFVTAGGTLHVTGRIKTPKSYFSLASSSTDGVLAAVGSNPPEPPSIDIISFDGEVLSTISLDRIRFPLPPKDICLPPSGDVLLLFSAKETLVCMTYDGTVKYSFQSTQPQDVKRPVSVDGDAQGNAYIADVEGHKIHVITKEGKYGGEVLSRKDGLREPLALYVTEGGHVVVTLGSGDVKTYVT
nr:hypothetical protein BaRGS_018313 [Batillaria attramentaria]